MDADSIALIGWVTTPLVILTAGLGIALAWIITAREPVRALAQRGPGWRLLVVGVVMLAAGGLLPGLGSFGLALHSLDEFYARNSDSWWRGTAGLERDQARQLYGANRLAVAGEVWLRGWAQAAGRLAPSLDRPCYAAQPLVCDLADVHRLNVQGDSWSNPYALVQGTGYWEWWLLITLGLVPALSAGLLARRLTNERSVRRAPLVL